MKLYKKLSLIGMVIFTLNPASSRELGIASIYRDHRTASGDLFNSAAFTCAHRTRPLCDLASFRKGTCPAKSIVTVRFAGKVVQCRVNDRGPYKRGRILDVSSATAAAMGLSWKQGLGKVELD